MSTLSIDLDLFLKDWQNKTPQELACIEQLKRALDIISKSDLCAQIVSIYLQGSFIRREMREGSDVDVKLVIKDDIHIGAFNQLKDVIDEQTKGIVGVGSYSLEQLIRGWYRKDEIKGSRTPPAYFVKYIPVYVLIYGIALDPKNYVCVTDEKEIVGLGSYVLKLISSTWGDKELERVRLVAKQGLFVLMIEDRIQSKVPVHQSRTDFAKKYESDAFIQNLLLLVKTPQHVTIATQKKTLDLLEQSLKTLVAKYSE